MKVILTLLLGLCLLCFIFGKQEIKSESKNPNLISEIQKQVCQILPFVSGCESFKKNKNLSDKFKFNWRQIWEKLKQKKNQCKICKAACQFVEKVDKKNLCLEACNVLICDKVKDKSNSDFKICKLLPFLCKKKSDPEKVKSDSNIDLRAEICKVLPFISGCEKKSTNAQLTENQSNNILLEIKKSFCSIFPFISGCSSNQISNKKLSDYQFFGVWEKIQEWSGNKTKRCTICKTVCTFFDDENKNQCHDACDKISCKNNKVTESKSDVSELCLYFGQFVPQCESKMKVAFDNGKDKQFWEKIQKESIQLMKIYKIFKKNNNKINLSDKWSDIFKKILEWLKNKKNECNMCKAACIFIDEPKKKQLCNDACKTLVCDKVKSDLPTMLFGTKSDDVDIISEARKLFCQALPFVAGCSKSNDNRNLSDNKFKNSLFCKRYPNERGC